MTYSQKPVTNILPFHLLSEKENKEYLNFSRPSTLVFRAQTETAGVRYPPRSIHSRLFAYSMVGTVFTEIKVLAHAQCPSPGQQPLRRPQWK